MCGVCCALCVLCCVCFVFVCVCARACMRVCVFGVYVDKRELVNKDEFEVAKAAIRLN